jgi:hypothetical protein
LEVYVKRNNFTDLALKKSSVIESEEAETAASTPPTQIPLVATQRRRDVPASGGRRGKSEGKKRV